MIYKYRHGKKEVLVGGIGGLLSINFFWSLFSINLGVGRKNWPFQTKHIRPTKHARMLSPHTTEPFTNECFDGQTQAQHCLGTTFPKTF